MGLNNTTNDLYIGKEFLNLESRTIKHPALIEHYANLNMYKTRPDIIELIGVDIETNHLTGEMKLLGFYEGNNEDYGPILKDGKVGGYRKYYNNDLYEKLFANIKYAIKHNKSLAHWNKLDAFQFFRLFAYKINDEEIIKRGLDRFENIQGEWDKKIGEWKVKPIISISNEYYEYGMVKAIRGSIQFFIRKIGDKYIDTCWSYNIASLYLETLEKEARYDPDNEFFGRFKWYSKVDESAHLVDWERFYYDDDYRNNIVLESNKLDAKSAMALGYEVQKDFKEAFGAYPTSLISQGAHARSAVTSIIETDLINQGFTGDELEVKKHDEISSICLKRHLDTWVNHYDNDLVKDLYLRCTEAYSGGMIETIMYGYAKSGFYADLAGAYLKQIQDLLDLRNSVIKSGTGVPPKLENSYILVRGLVTVPEHINYHPITIKHPFFKETNIRPTGTFWATYTSEEREFNESLGCTFQNEDWIAVITQGKLSVFSHASKKVTELRNHLISIGSLAEGQVKRIGNSFYGILFEATILHNENEDTGLAEKIGYRAGEFWNPLWATFITSRTRIILSKACIEIEKNGGQPILLMTDSITWKGKKTDLPERMILPFGESGVKVEKTLGYFESPDEINDIICFGSGRYGFNKVGKKGKIKYISKRRGMIIKDYVNKDKIPLEKGFHWSNFMKLMVHYNTTIIPVITRKLISTGILANSIKYTISDLGRIVEEEAELDLISGKEKRIILKSQLDPVKLSTGMVMSKPVNLDFGVYDRNGYTDGTLPFLREKVKDKKLRSKKLKNRDNGRARAINFRTLNKEEINDEKRAKYQYLRNNGFSAKDAGFRNNYSWSRLKDEVEMRKLENEVNKGETRDENNA